MNPLISSRNATALSISCHGVCCPGFRTAFPVLSVARMTVDHAMHETTAPVRQLARVSLRKVVFGRI